jgi:hypothetical protein
MEIKSSGEFKKRELEVMKEKNVPLNDLAFRMDLRKNNFEHGTTSIEKEQYKAIALQRKKEYENLDISQQ